MKTSLILQCLALVATSACSQEADKPTTPSTSSSKTQQTVPGPPTGTVVVSEYLTQKSSANVIVISFDALRADALGCYGGTRGLTPNLDKFAQRALRFDQAHTISPVTATSFAGAWTGRYPTKVFHDWKLDDVTTLAEAFKESSYKTVAIINNAQLTPARNYNQGFDTYSWHLTAYDDPNLAEALTWANAPKTGPVFAWLHFLSPHSPYEWQASATHLYNPAYTGRYLKSTTGTFDTEDPLEASHIRNLYDGEVLHADAMFGQLMAAIEKSGMLKNSIIMITADHGDEFKERGIYQHRHLYQETMRIPLIIFHPDRGTGAVSTDVVSNLDFYPTLLSLAGIPIKDTVIGLDLTKDVRGSSPLYGLAMTDPDYRGASIRNGQYKLILDLKPAYKEHLFDLRSDPLEVEDISSTNRELTEKMANTIWQEIGDENVLIPGKWTDYMEGLSPATVEALRSLGY